MSYVVDILPPMLIALYCIAAIRYRWKPRTSLLAGLVLLLLSAATYPVHGLSDHLAFSAFYFLLAGAALLTAESIRQRRGRR